MSARGKAPWPERLAGLLGLIMLVAVLGILLHQALLRPDTPPGIRLEAGTAEALGPGLGYHLPVTAQNLGNQTAASLRVQGEIRREGQVVETSLLEFDYVPDRSQRRGGLFFREDPRQGELVLRPLGYADP
ncbi:hypothetical protein ACFOD4_15630 [Pseudoroseomonas globiformis]|uniref:TIGR02588 family protein n=1 Tax=Teichococcus globiformis TaxID=2307229 RepID=A0ABV7G1D0_9PROT